MIPECEMSETLVAYTKGCRDILDSVRKLCKVYRFPATSFGQLETVIRQMSVRGTVSREDFMHLGEYLPELVAWAAELEDVEPAELMNMARAGTIKSEPFLSSLAEEIDKRIEKAGITT